MKLLILGSLLALALGTCSEKSVGPQADPLVIHTGTSFGFCTGYCVKDYVITGTTITLTQRGTSRQGVNPDKTCQTSLGATAWDALKAKADFTAFSKIPPTLGCPDCADGGAEYIELQQGDAVHRVTFEYGATIPGFESLVSDLRAKRESLKACN